MKEDSKRRCATANLLNINRKQDSVPVIGLGGKQGVRSEGSQKQQKRLEFPSAQRESQLNRLP